MSIKFNFTKEVYSKKLSLRVTDETYEYIEGLASQYPGTSVGSIGRDLLKSAIEEHKLMVVRTRNKE